MNLITQAAIKEVYDCHILIEKWFHGRADATPELLNQLLEKFSDDFSMINPKGNVLTYSALSTFLTSMRGSRPSVKIEVTPPQIILNSDSCAILQYEEIQHLEQQTLHRLSTAVFISDKQDGVLWRHLHETWHPE